MFEKCITLLNDRGVTLYDIADCVMYLQAKYHPEITVDEVLEVIHSVISKREVQHAIITGVSLDMMAEQNTLCDKDLQAILMDDYSLYGIDEVLAYGICNLYGSIALTNYGYIDKVKPGIIEKLNEHIDGTCNTFLDDIVGAIAASAASKIAHNHSN